MIIILLFASILTIISYIVLYRAKVKVKNPNDELEYVDLKNKFKDFIPMVILFSLIPGLNLLVALYWFYQAKLILKYNDLDIDPFDVLFEEIILRSRKK